MTASSTLSLKERIISRLISCVILFHDSNFFGHLMLLQFPQSLKVPTKIDHHFHYLEIQAIESKKPNQVVFK